MTVFLGTSEIFDLSLLLCAGQVERLLAWRSLNGALYGVVRAGVLLDGAQAEPMPFPQDLADGFQVRVA
jgi:hypothetical protein